MRVTLRTVATQLGFHRSTLSRALRNDPSIPPATRKKIQAACTKLGYRPNSILSQLGADHWQSGKLAAGNTIAYIDRTSPVNRIGSTSISSYREQAVAMGYQLEVFRSADFQNSAKLQRILRARGITDVIFGPMFEEQFAVELDWDKFICVQVKPGYFSLPLHSVVIDYFNSVTLAWQKAVERGYRRIGITLLQHPVRVIDDFLRLCAAQGCQNLLYPHLPKLPPFLVPPTTFIDVEAFVAWVKAHNPDVIIAFNESYHDVIRWKFGPDIAFACINLVNARSLSGIYDTAESCGRESINLIHFCRRTYQWGLPKVRVDHVVEPIWNEGTTLPQKKVT